MTHEGGGGGKGLAWSGCSSLCVDSEQTCVGGGVLKTAVGCGVCPLPYPEAWQATVFLTVLVRVLQGNRKRERRKSKKREGSGREERERKRTTDLFYVIGSLGSHDCGHWQVQNLQGESQAADPGPSGLQFASKGHPLENPPLFGCFLFLFYTGVQLIK